MHYLLFFPKSSTASPELLARHHLEGLAEKLGPDFLRGEGPDGVPGMIATWHYGEGHSPDFENVKWTHFQIDGEPLGWYLGIQETPTPKDLAVPDQIQGAEVTLGDGNKWVVPQSMYVPKTNRFDSVTRKWRSGPDDRFVDFCHEAEKYASRIMEILFQLGNETRLGTPNAKSVQFQLDGILDFICRCLAMNYRLTPEIISHLGLLDEKSIARAIHAICGDPEADFISVAKKNFMDNLVSIPVGSISLTG